MPTRNDRETAISSLMASVGVQRLLEEAGESFIDVANARHWRLLLSTSYNMENGTLPCGICIIPTVTPPVMSANKSFLMLYFGSQLRIGINRNRN
ncbi:hypothetical protein P5673_029841 [Acropora cervicornis]|uniref:Uncharacterized protein n=1 Tax=Acropora cervicornis TaxID=6130 RepID=A0AAD9PV42_ACRCE|nr:hypothetical protein P5673_029841 [Acropora cervicornis]